MLYLNPKNISKIITILLCISLIFTILNSILLPFNGSNEKNYSKTDNLIENSVEGLDEIKVINNNVENNGLNVYNINNPISNYQPTDHIQFTPNFQQNEISRKTRNNNTDDYDLRIKNINISYSGLFYWPVNSHLYIIAGEIGKVTNFSIVIKNVGKNDIDISENVLVNINLTDYLGHSSWERIEYIGHLSKNKELTINFTWIPTYSNRFNLTCNISFQNDTNTTNNLAKINFLHTKKWSDDLEDKEVDDWMGDLDSDSWHLTDSIEEEPNASAHTSPIAFYHGKEEEGVPDDYGERNDLDLITPWIDLRRFDKKRVAFFNFKFYGATSNQDTITIEGYKSSEDKWYPIDDIDFPKETVNIFNQPAWFLWRTGDYRGIPIHTFAGELTQFKIHWHSDQSPENEIGFYLDDFFIYGFESPIPEYDISIESVEILPDNLPVMVGQEFEIKAKVTNLGENLINNLKCKIKVNDITGRLEDIAPIGGDIIDSLQYGESKVLTWIVNPSVAGIYYINLSVTEPLDKIKNNNFIFKEKEIYSYYTTFESNDPNWLSEPGWTRVQIGNEDPAPSEHSWSDAWYVGNISSKIYDKNMSTGLYSPIIDLDGAQTNDLYKNNQIEIGFKWFGETSNNDILYFEYALDHTDNWFEFNVTNETQSKINGDKSDRWYSWDSLGFPELFGHHVQFRWRFESDLISNDNEMGYYIDDFFVWVVQEQYGRPIITGCQIYPNSVINDSHDSVHLTCQVTNSSSLSDVYVDLTPLNGPSNQILFDDGTTHGDQKNGDNEFTIDITVSPDIPSGDYILKLTTMDELNRFDNNYVKITVKENLAPVIIEYSPGNLSLNIDEDESILFQIDAMDPEGGELKYSWYLNSILINDWTKDFFQFDSQFHGQYSAGNYQLKVIVADNGYPNKFAFVDWNIWVIDVLPDFQVEDKDIKISGDGVAGNNVTENALVNIRVWIHNLRPPTENNVSIIFIQQSTNASIEDYIFQVYNISKFPGNESTLITILWRANISTKYIKVWVDPADQIIELDEDNNEASILVNVSKPPLVETPDNVQINSTDNVPILLYIVDTGIITSLIALSFAIGTEFGRYKLFSMLAPLYYRVTGDKVLEHKLRSKIYMHIRANPGDHYRSIMTKLKIKNGTLVHHLSRLEQEELIRSERDGYFKRFYPVSMRIPKSEVGMYYPEGIPTYNIGEHQVSEIQLKIIETMRKYPGLTQKDIANKVNESRRVVNYHIKLLEQHNLIRVVKSGRTTQCYAVEKRTSS